MTELKIEKVTEDSPLKAKVQRIYIKSFPLFERVSLEPFFNSVSDGVEIFALSDEEMARINALDRGEKHDWY